jgi:hypothetical protein
MSQNNGVRETDDGGAAFPLEFTEQDKDSDLAGEQIVFCGLSIRDYFATRALQSLIPLAAGTKHTDLGIARDSYAFADAMLKARQE